MDNTIKTITFLFVILLITTPLFAAEKIYLRDYTYQASETDSKITARETALLLIKQNLLGEIGTYVDSKINIFSSSNGINVSSEQIQAITEGFIKTEIIQEKWNGVTFYIKAKLTADPDNIADRLRKIYQINNKNKSAVSEEFEFWSSVVKINAIDSYTAYLVKYPKGKYEELAQIAITRLQKEKAEGINNNRWLVNSNEDITLVARHDVGLASDLDSNVITSKLINLSKKIIKRYTPENITFHEIADLEQSEKFSINPKDQGLELCRKGNTNLVAGVMLEDHSGRDGMLRPVKLFMLNCKNNIFKQSSFVPKEMGSNDFWRDTAIRKNLRVFIQDYLDMMN